MRLPGQLPPPVEKVGPVYGARIAIAVTLVDGSILCECIDLGRTRAQKFAEAN
jgi:hypothetical protein